MKKKIAIMFTFIVVTLSLLFTGSIHAEETEETVPTSTIGSINGPADVSTSSSVLVVDDSVCYDLGGGVGQTAIGFMPCTPETTIVEVGYPPSPTTLATEPEQLPATGTATDIFTTAVGLLAIGVLLIRFTSRR